MKQVLGLKQQRNKMVAYINIISAYNLTLDKNVLTKNIAKHLKILITVMNELNQDPNQNKKARIVSESLSSI